MWGEGGECGGRVKSDEGERVRGEEKGEGLRKGEKGGRVRGERVLRGGIEG